MSRFATAEEYYMARDCFIEYVREHVNPAREKCSLRPIDLLSARETFRLLDEEPWKGKGSGR